MINLKVNCKETLKELLQLELSKINELIQSYLGFIFKIYSASLLVNHNANQHYDEHFVNTLTDSELDKLIRILVIYEKYHFQGSATAVPNLLRILFQREYKEFESLFDWVIQNNQNEYIPMGTFKGQNIKTLEEYALNIAL